MTSAGHRSGACRSDDLPNLHRVCPGHFTRSAGEMESSRIVTCWCDCHRPGTTLHRLIRDRGAARQS